MNIDEVKALYIFGVKNIDDDSQYDEVQKVKKIFKDALDGAYEFCTNVEDYTNIFNTRHHIETTDNGIKLHIDFKKQDVKFKNYISHLNKQKYIISDEQFLGKIKKDLRLSFRRYDTNDFQKIDVKTLEKSLDKDKIIRDMTLVYESQRFTFIDRLDKKLKQYKDKKYGVQFSENNGVNNMSFTSFLNGGFKAPKTTINESKIAFSNKSSFIEDVVGEVLGYCNSEFVAEMEKIAEYLKINLDDVIDHVIETFSETSKRQKGFWQLGSVAQDAILYAIVSELENRDIKAEYDNSSPSYPSLTVNEEDVQNLKDLKEVLKELDKDDD